MSLENNLGDSNIAGGNGKDYLPFATQYFENPKPRGCTKEEEITQYTSVTFCTWKLIPLIDDGD